jgi:hypothetical protein
MFPTDNPLFIILAVLGVIAVIMAIIYAARGGKNG